MLIRKYLATVLGIIEELKRGEIVIIESSEKYTGLPLLALVQLFVDPFCCTLKGFCSLLEKHYFSEVYVRHVFSEVNPS